MLSKSKIKKIAIIQRLIPHYRIDFFKEVCARSQNQVTVFHSTKIVSDGLVESDNFTFPNCKVSMKDHRWFCFQNLLMPLITAKFDYIVLGLELRIFSNTLIWLTSFFTKTKIVWWTHGFNVHLRRKGPSYFADRFFKTIMMKYSHRILLYNEYRIEELADWGIPPDKLIVLNNAINEKPHRAALKNVSQATCDQIEASTRVSSHTLLFIGRITPAKRVDLIIKLSGMIVKFFPDLRVFIIGDGSDRFKLQGLTQKMGLEKNIFFMGTINDPVELSGYMSLADFSVLPGAVGLSIVHSMICGIPFVTLKDSPHSPEIAYLRDNYNGFAASNLQEMGGWIITQFKNPSKLKTMKMNCVNMINKEVNLNHMVTQYLNGIDL